MAGSSWALVAIKARAECKERLAGYLTPAARLMLVRFMLRRVLDALAGAQGIERIAVVTPEADFLPPDVLVLPDPGGGLNAALEAARRTLVHLGAGELIILSADLPLVTVADIDLLMAQGRRTGFALASDVACTGTNALYLMPSAPFRFQFGHDSRSKHLAEAARLGLTSGIVQTPGLACDLDNVEDLRHLGAANAAFLTGGLPFAAEHVWQSQTRCG